VPCRAHRHGTRHSGANNATSTDNVRQISVRDCGGLPSRVFFFAPLNHFMCQIEVGICVKDKRSMLSCSNHWRERTPIWIVPPQHSMIARSRKDIGNMADHENNNEARNPSPWFLLSSNAQDHAINKVLDTINHCDATTPAYSPRLLFHLRLHQSRPSYGREKRVTGENTGNKGNNTVVNIIIRRKRENNLLTWRPGPHSCLLLLSPPSS